MPHRENKHVEVVVVTISSQPTERILRDTQRRRQVHIKARKIRWHLPWWKCCNGNNNHRVTGVGKRNSPRKSTTLWRNTNVTHVATLTPQGRTAERILQDFSPATWAIWSVPSVACGFHPLFADFSWVFLESLRPLAVAFLRSLVWSSRAVLPVF